MASLPYRAEIDGFRALAILPVILYHHDKHLVPGGYLGVDMFFVISGFLICSILFKEVQQGAFSIRSFWSRRIRRILPLVIVVIWTTGVFHFLFFFAPDVQAWSIDIIASLLFSVNIHFFLQSVDYWQTSSLSSPYLHFWSLSVEEQFYVVFPFIFLTAKKMTQGPRAFQCVMLWVVSVILVSSFLLSIYWHMINPHAAFYTLPARAWEFGVGALGALALKGCKPFQAFYTTVGLVLVLCAYSGIPSTFIGSVGLLACVNVGTFLLLGSSQSLVLSLIFQNKVAVYIGKISYSLYLWHWVVFASHSVGLQYGWPAVDPWLLIGTIFPLSSLSYHFVECPFRKNPRITKFILFCTICSALCVPLVHLKLSRRHYDERQFHTSHWAGVHYDMNPYTGGNEALHRILNHVRILEPKHDKSGFSQGGIIKLRDNKRAPRVVVLGDSHAVMWSHVIDEITEELGVSVALWSLNGENPYLNNPPQIHTHMSYLSPGERYLYDSNRLKLLQEWRPELVILAARWDKVGFSDSSELFDFLDTHSNKVLLIDSPPVLEGIGNRNFGEFISFTGAVRRDSGKLIWGGYNKRHMASIQSQILNQVKLRQNFSLLRISDLYVHKDSVWCGQDQILFYLDDDHLTTEGTRLAKEPIKKVIKQSLP